MRVAHVNPRMPRTRGSATVALADLDYVIDAEALLLLDQTGEDEVWSAIGRHLATVVPDGAVLEVGIGQTPQVLTSLIGHRRLRLHTGAIMTPVLALVGSGALAEEQGAIVTGTALGIDELYAFVADNPQVAFAPVGYTHNIGVLARIPRFTAINSVIEVDLWGEANAEMAGGGRSPVPAVWLISCAAPACHRAAGPLSFCRQRQRAAASRALSRASWRVRR